MGIPKYTCGNNHLGMFYDRGLRMLSLVLGSDITDASVAAIASSFSKLELLDLSGYVHQILVHVG